AGWVLRFRLAPGGPGLGGPVGCPQAAPPAVCKTASALEVRLLYRSVFRECRQFLCMKGYSRKKVPARPCMFRQLSKAPLERFAHPKISKPPNLRPENHGYREETPLPGASRGGESRAGNSGAVL